MSKDGVVYKAMFVNVRRKASLYTNIALTRPNGDIYRYERAIDLKRELNTRRMKGERHNVYVVQDLMENFIHNGVHQGFPEEFLRAAWQRTSYDRIEAIYQCFEPTGKGKDKKDSEQDLFS